MGHRPDEAFAIRGPLKSEWRSVLLFAAPALVLLSWIGLSFSGLVENDFLPTPIEVLDGIVELWLKHELGMSIWISSRRILIAFGLSVLVAFPLGVLMGAFTPVERFFEPVMAPLRYMPISAFIPLLILWFGIYEKQKIAFLFLGTFVFLLPVVVTAIRAVPEELIQTALTLGAGRWAIIRTVLIPHALPEIFDSFRVMNAIAWTYVILAEAVNAGGGLGYMTELSRTHHRPDWSFACLIVIGGIGLTTDFVIRTASRLLFRWREAA